MKANLIVLLPQVPGYDQCVQCGDQWHEGYKYGCVTVEGVGKVCFDCREKEEDTDEG